MCLINFHFQSHPKYKLIVVANRDEEYNRPTEQAHFWTDYPNILAGRDLLQMGTWFGVTKEGRFAAITNYRDPRQPLRPYSRGDIVKRFLAENIDPKEFVKGLAKNRELYGGYNLLIGDGDFLIHYNNILDETNVISPGTHSISNHTLNTPWPKVLKGRTRLSEYIKNCKGELNIEDLFQIVLDKEQAKDTELPDTGVGLEMERVLSSMFIQLPSYGTRSSTVLLIDNENHLSFAERSFINGKFQNDSRFEFQIH